MSVNFSRFLIPSPPTFTPSPNAFVSLIDNLTADQWLPNRELSVTGSIRHAILDPNGITVDVRGARFPFTLLPWVPKRKPSATYLQMPRLVEAPPLDAAFVQAQLDNGGLLLQYSVRQREFSNSIRFPLRGFDHAADMAYYDLSFRLSSDFVYVTSESLEGYDNTRCDCGCELAHEKPNDVFSPCEHFAVQCPECGIPFRPQDRLFRVHCGFTGKESTVPGGAVFRFAIEIDCGKCIPDSPVDFSPDFRKVCSRTLECDFIEMSCLD